MRQSRRKNLTTVVDGSQLRGDFNDRGPRPPRPERLMSQTSKTGDRGFFPTFCKPNFSNRTSRRQAVVMSFSFNRWTCSYSEDASCFAPPLLKATSVALQHFHACCIDNTLVPSPSLDNATLFIQPHRSPTTVDKKNSTATW